MDTQAMLAAFRDGAGIDASVLGFIIAGVLGVLFLLWGGIGIKSVYGLFVDERIESGPFLSMSARILFLVLFILSLIATGI